MTEVYENIYIPVEDLHSFVVLCLVQVGVTTDDATIVADVLIAANLRGIDSHGVARLFRYVDGVRHGKISPQTQIANLREGPTTAVLDAANSLGQPVAVTAMRLAIDKAEKVGIGMVAVRGANHFGIAGYYAMLALEHNMIGIVTTNASPQVAPTFGAQPMYGTNPIAIAVPTGGPYPFVLDMATSIVPRGKLEQLHRRGQPIPSGWAIDDQGVVMTDNQELITGLMQRRGYSLLPLGGMGETLGGHKGYGLGLFIDLICGPLAGAAWGLHVYGPAGANLGQCFLALRVDNFRNMEEFSRETEQLLDELRAAKKIPGQERIYIPGEKEAEEVEYRRQTGIPLPPIVYARLRQLAEELGVNF